MSGKPSAERWATLTASGNSDNKTKRALDLDTYSAKFLCLRVTPIKYEATNDRRFDGSDLGYFWIYNLLYPEND
jgi:hypothetical protein